MTVTLKGFDELSEAFAGLRDDMKIKVSRRMVAAGGGVLRKEARALAQRHGFRRSGALIRNIAIKRERRAPPGETQYNLGVRHGRALGNGKKVTKYLALSKTGRIITKRANDPFYWRFLEFGTRYIEGKSFIEQSLKNKSAEVVAAMEAKLQQEISKANNTAKK